MVVNLCLALTKFTAGFFGHSFALIADGLESTADLVTGLVVYLGLKIALRPPDKNFPYGHGKAVPSARSASRSAGARRSRPSAQP
jgi:divalent metal cation (Fe/Co/Zn/Cd) transporter